MRWLNRGIDIENIQIQEEMESIWDTTYAYMPDSDEDYLDNCNYYFFEEAYIEADRWYRKNIGFQDYFSNFLIYVLFDRFTELSR